MFENIEEYKFKRNYIICSNDEGQLNVLEELFKMIKYMGYVGESHEIKLYVDGEGAVRLGFYKEGEPLKFKENEPEPDLGYGNIQIDNDHLHLFYDLG